MTNADRIRAMTDEELAAAMVHIGECGNNCPMHAYCETRTYPRACRDTLLEWLQKEVTE